MEYAASLRWFRSSAQSRPVPRGVSQAWTDRLWMFAVGGLDRGLRRYHHVYEYTDAPECVFRIAIARAPRDILLSDGTVTGKGERIGVLHFWNEHLPRFGANGPDLHWAKIAQRQLHISLLELRRHLDSDPAWADVRALRAEAVLPMPPRARRQLYRLAERYGFEVGDPGAAYHSIPSLIGDNLLVWGFMRAYNPRALSRHHLLRKRQELWLSRQTLDAIGSRGARRRATSISAGDECLS